MTPGNEVYTEVAEKLGAPKSERILKLLQAYFSPGEGKVLLELFDSK